MLKAIKRFFSNDPDATEEGRDDVISSSCFSFERSCRDLCKDMFIRCKKRHKASFYNYASPCIEAGIVTYEDIEVFIGDIERVAIAYKGARPKWDEGLSRIDPIYTPCFAYELFRGSDGSVNVHMKSGDILKLTCSMYMVDNLYSTLRRFWLRHNGKD